MTILVADDEKDIRNLLKINFEENGYSVITAENGKVALDIIQKEEISLAIFDVMMPIIDGFNLLRLIREKNILIPVIFLTARDDEMDKILGLGLGADDYISKPFSFSELLARVKAQLRRNIDYTKDKKIENKIIEYGELVIDKEKCCAYKNSSFIELGAKEFKLLSYFMENSEKVFTKQQLYRAIWSDDLYYDDNTIMVHISRLRSKIEDNPQNPKYLKTIRGIGYKLHYLGDS